MARSRGKVYELAMFVRAPLLLACFVLVSSVCAPKVAIAWVETAVRGHHARITVEPDGRAIVRHELVLKIRGGPMKLLEVGGIGTNVQPLPDATVRRAVEGSSSLWPVVVESQEDGSLRLKIGAPRGIRGGSYLFAFGYGISLDDAGLIEAQEDGFEISWVGPRLSSGVDSARVTFVVPRGSRMPRISESTEGMEENVLLGEIRRGELSDEVDLVRAHLATGEPAIWKLWVSRDAFSPDLRKTREAQIAPDPIAPSIGEESWFSESRRESLIVAALTAGLFSLLLFFKGRSVARLARLSEARAKPLIVAPPWLRALLGFGAVGSAVWFALDHQPTIAVALGSFGAALGTFLLPVRLVRPRGPGQWELMASEKEKDSVLPGALWEVRSLAGFAFCTVLVLTIVFVGYRILPVSNYLALMSIALAALIIPLFWTGERSDFPQSPLAQARPWFRYLKRACESDVLSVQLWGRRPTLDGVASEQCDEVRVRLVLSQPPVGLRALEVAFEEAAGAHVMPSVVLRVLEDSPALSALPRELPWQRGRTAEERVALLRPAAPTMAQLLRLVRSLVSTLRVARSRSSAQVSPLRSEGSGDRASNDGTPAAAPLM